MADFDPTLAITLIESNRNIFGTDHSEQDAYLKEAKARLGARSADDRKEAAKLAVETAKSFLTVAIAVLVATGTFVQFAKTNGVGWVSLPMACFAVTAVLLFLSMVNGFTAISSAYKRADGRKESTLPAWSTEALAPRLNWQARFGFLSLLTLIVGLILWANAEDQPTAAVNITLPSTQNHPFAKGPITIEGIWTELRIRTAGNQEMKLPPNSSPVQVTCK